VTQKSKTSLYLTLGITVAVTVIMVTLLNVSHKYTETKEIHIKDKISTSEKSALILQENIATFIEAYAVYEYERLILAELEHQDYLAILVEDENMGKLLDKAPFISGKIKNPNGDIVDYAPLKLEHKKWLRRATMLISETLLTLKAKN